MVEEERKSAGNLKSGGGGDGMIGIGVDEESKENPIYQDLMDLIYSGMGDDGQPTVMEVHDNNNTHMSSGVPQAIPFVTVSENGTGDELEISTEAMEFLDGMQHRKIAVIAICGTQNTGKSFLANRYLGRMQGFKTKGLLGQGTRGIWMWNQVVPVGNEVDGIVLDCQGLTLDGTGAENDVGDAMNGDLEEKIFTLALLLASQLVFNTKGHITDQTMDELAILPLMSSKIRIREHKSRKGEQSADDADEDEEEDFSSDEEGDSTEFYKYFPQFNWVVRDLNMDF